MEQVENVKIGKFSIKELNLENLSLARESLVKKGEEHLINFLDSCYTGDLSDADDFKGLYDQVKEYIEFINDLVAKIESPGNRNIKIKM